ncbi:unannotated protein [freshwater metagenome]|uniref:Unannotated protein n=1 Tax=freshwater metagenome TaxID=449393 RepID=A0A6J7ALL1_9ZZZZ
MTSASDGWSFDRSTTLVPDASSVTPPLYRFWTTPLSRYSTTAPVRSRTKVLVVVPFDVDRCRSAPSYPYDSEPIAVAFPRLS